MDKEGGLRLCKFCFDNKLCVVFSSKIFFLLKELWLDLINMIFFWFDFNFLGVLIYKWCNWFFVVIGFFFLLGINGLNRLNV